MIFLRLFFEFFKTGLFAVGGNAVDLRRKRGKIHIRTGKAGADQPNSRLFQLFSGIGGAEVRVDDVHVGNGDALPALPKLHRQIDGNVGFAAAVVPAEEQNAFEIHGFLPSGLK